MPTTRTGARNFRHRSFSSSSESSSAHMSSHHLKSHLAPPPMKHGGRPMEKPRLLTHHHPSGASPPPHHGPPPPMRKRSLSHSSGGPPPKRRPIDTRYMQHAGEYSSHKEKPPISPRRPDRNVPYTREDLEKITIDIRRNIREPSPTLRRIMDPTEIKIVRRKNEGARPLFEREEIKVPSVDLREDKVKTHKYDDIYTVPRQKVDGGGLSYSRSFDNGPPPSLTLSQRWQSADKKQHYGRPPHDFNKPSHEKPRYNSPPPMKERRYPSISPPQDNRRKDLRRMLPPPPDQERYHRKENYADGPGPIRKPLRDFDGHPRDRMMSRRSPEWDHRMPPRHFKESPEFYERHQNYHPMRRSMGGRPPMRYGRGMFRSRGNGPMMRGGRGMGSFRGNFRPRSNYRGGMGPRGYGPSSESSHSPRR